MSRVRPLGVMVKALILFAVFNLGFALLNPPVSDISIYGWLVDSRERFPYGGNEDWYSIDPADLDAYFAVHSIASRAKGPKEYRVLVLGDSQTWGYPLALRDTAVSKLNDAHLSACGHDLVFYNLAYPRASVLKDFLILDRGMAYQPDMIVWMTTLYGFMGYDSREPLFQANAPHTLDVLKQYGLERYKSRAGVPPNILERTIIGQRSRLARLALLQAFGLLWDATDIDVASVDYLPLPVDMPADRRLGPFPPPNLPVDRMAFDVLRAARQMIGDLPTLIVNEPIYIATGKNSDIRYDSFYPRWAYDEYRKLLPTFVAQQGWNYVDLYDLIPSAEFTETELHISAKGERMLEQALKPKILDMKCP